MTTRTLAHPLALGLVLGALVAPSARADIGAFDPVPAATLLFPYVEADLSPGTTRDTHLVVENARSTPQLAHVILWTDLGVPVDDFDVYLPPHGRLTMSLRALLTGQPPSGAAHTEGGCTIPRAPLSEATVAELVAALTGQRLPSASDNGFGCPGHDHGDGIARGYVTVDVIDACGASEHVADGSYWSRLATDNALLGSFTLDEGANRPSYAQQAVHIEASLTHPATDGVVSNPNDGEHTFYGALVGYSGADHREPLPTLWNTPHQERLSDLLVWRDTKRTLLDPAAVPCGAAQDALALDSVHVFYTDENEQLVQHGGGKPFPRATGRYLAGGPSGLPNPYRSGSVLTNLSFEGQGVPANVAPFAQSVVLSTIRPDARGAAVHATLTYGTPLDRSLGPSVAYWSTPPQSEGPPSLLDNVAMLDAAPGSSLVLPYFEVALDDPNRAATELRIVNTGTPGRLVKVTLFTDRGVPTESILVYLTGYDIETIDLRQLFEVGLVSRTASAGQDPSNEISPQGPYSQDINYASCNGRLPPQRLDEERRAFLRAAHTGAPTSAWGGKCGARALGDDIARGYVLIDEITYCFDGPITAELWASNSLPSREGLAGSFVVRNRIDDVSFGGSLLSLQQAGAVLSAGDPAWYGWLDGWTHTTTINPRDPLPGTIRVPFHGAGTGSSELVIFRPVYRPAEPYICDETPASFSAELSITAFDDADNSSVLSGFVPGFVTGRVPLYSGGLVVPYTTGALEIDFDFSEPNGPPGAPDAHMGFVGVIERRDGGDTTYLPGFPLRRAGEQ